MLIDRQLGELDENLHGLQQRYVMQYPGRIPPPLTVLQALARHPGFSRVTFSGTDLVHTHDLIRWVTKVYVQELGLAPDKGGHTRDNLRLEMKRRGLQVSGLKAELVERLADDLAREVVTKTNAETFAYMQTLRAYCDHFLGPRIPVEADLCAYLSTAWISWVLYMLRLGESARMVPPNWWSEKLGA